MSRPNFRFKQFEVWHDKCAMKVGTDGVLLGAWCPIGEFRSLGVQEFRSTSEQAQSASEPLPTIKVLDIGTGSGLIALMIAQRLANTPLHFAIDAIDIDTGAVEQSQLNFARSPWAKHLRCEHTALQVYPSEERYNLIVSNPPYFQDSLKNPNQARATARHTDTLSYGELIHHAARLLAEQGTLALILPAEAEQSIIGLAQEQQLYPTHITHVHSKPGKEAKRILIALARSAVSPIINSLCIESTSSPRSKEYQEMTKEFYL